MSDILDQWVNDIKIRWKHEVNLFEEKILDLPIVSRLDMVNTVIVELAKVGWGGRLELSTISDWSQNKDRWHHNCVFILKGPDEALEFLVQCLHGKQQINDFSEIVNKSQTWEVKGLPCMIFNLWWIQTEDRTGNDYVYFFRLGPEDFAGRYTSAKRGSRR